MKSVVTGISLALLKVLIAIKRSKNFIAQFFISVTAKPVAQIQLISALPMTNCTLQTLQTLCV
jgi:hypothetical protein